MRILRVFAVHKPKVTQHRGTTGLVEKNVLTLHVSVNPIYQLGGVLYEGLTGGETIDETEHPQYFTHETSQFSIARFTEDARFEFVNSLLRGMLRRAPDDRLSATSVAQLCTQILQWKPGASSPQIDQEDDPADKAAKAYLKRSRTIRDELVRSELRALCRAVVDRLSHLNKDGGLNQVGTRVDVNEGDHVPFAVLKQQYPDGAGLAVRVMMEFPTTAQRALVLGYVFVVRPGTDRDIVGVMQSKERNLAKPNPADVVPVWKPIDEFPPNSPAIIESMTALVIEEHKRVRQLLALQIDQLP